MVLRALLCVAASLLIHRDVAIAAENAGATRATYHKYLIIGAGPGGLQLAHYLDSAGRDYLILEKHDIPGSFFRRFPRFRQLISINKWNTGRDDLEFNQRHDWNSLLSEPSHASTSAHGYTHNRSNTHCLRWDKTLPGGGGMTVVRDRLCITSDFSSTNSLFNVRNVAKGLQMRDYSRDYYPHADRLVEYMQHWVTADARRGDVMGNTSSAARRMRFGGNLNIRYNTSVIRIRPTKYTESRTHMEAVAENLPRFQLMTSTGEVFECTFLIVAGGFQKLMKALGKNVAELADNYWTASTDMRDYENKHVLILGRGNAAFEFATNVLEVAASVHLLGRIHKRVSPSWESHYPGDVRMVHAKLLETYLLKSMDAMAEIPMETMVMRFDNSTGKFALEDHSQPCTKDGYGRHFSRCFFRKQFDAQPFELEVRPNPHPSKKYPLINARYESANVPGLFFAGTLMHSHDFKKSSGGFIHGFRYLVRALHRILEEDEQAAAEGVAPGRSKEAPTATASVGAAGSVKPMPPAPFAAWPRRPVRGLRESLSMLMRRINHAAAMYQMFGAVGDVLLLPPMTPRMAKGFVNVGVRAATVDPGTFYDPQVHDVNIPQFEPQIAGATNLDFDRLNSDEAISRALVGAYFEDVPVKLIPQKVPAWSAQTAYGWQSAEFDAGDITTHGALSSAGGGYEYLVLTLEFGKGSSSNPDAAATREGVKPGVSEWARDPFSLLRANVSLMNPEDSHFLHPVLRFYNTRLSTETPVAECHVLEDFHVDWTHYVAHTLPVARCLQDIGARRAQAALAMGAALAKSSTAATKPTSGDFKIARDVLKKVWMVRREGNTHMELLKQHLHLSVVDLWYGGVPISGGEGWINFLSVNATDHLLHRGPRMVLIHYVDTHPLPPSQEEAEAVERLREAFNQDAKLAMQLASTSVPLPPLTSEQQRMKQHNEAYLRQFYTEITYKIPGLAIMSVDARTMMGRYHSQGYGVTSIPLFRVYDQWRGVMDFPGTDFDKIPENIQYLLSTHDAAYEALLDNDDTYLFPGYTVPMLKGMALGNGFDANGFSAADSDAAVRDRDPLDPWKEGDLALRHRSQPPLGSYPGPGSGAQGRQQPLMGDAFGDNARAPRQDGFRGPGAPPRGAPVSKPRRPSTNKIE